MKKHLYVLAILAFGLHSCGPTYVVHQAPPPAYAPPPEPAPEPPPAAEPPPAEVSYQSFYDQLAPYGQWINNPDYGYVWMPNVGPDFKPYATNGHWVYTDAGWTWASNYSWGWATFHYGRWFYEDGYGWMWIPGQEWAPAWVSWRQSSDYYGWAPLAPSNGPAAVSINISIGGGGGYNPPSHYWNFVPTRYVTSPQVNNYYVSEQKNVTIINNTTVINNTYVNNNTTNITNNNIRNTNITNNNITNNNVTNNNVTNNITNNNTTNNITNNRVNNTVNNYGGGPNPNDVSRYTGTTVRAVPLRNSATPGEQASGNGLAIYRPRVAAAAQGNAGSNNNTPRPAPGRVQTLSNVRPVNTSVYSGNSNNTPAINTRPGGNGNSVSTPNTGSNTTVPNQGYNRPATNPVAAPVTTPATNNYNQPNNNPRPAPNQPNQYQSNQNRVTAPVTNQNNAGNNPAYNNGRPVNNQPSQNQSIQPVRNNQPVSRPQQANQPVNPSNPRPVSQPAKPGYQPANQQAGQQGNFNRNRFQAPVPAQNQQRANAVPAKPVPKPVTRPVNPPRDTEKKDNK